MEDERPISFVGTTASDSETVETWEFEKPGTLTRAKVVTHKGQQYALQTYAEIIRNGRATTLWRPLDKEFLAGNGQVFDLPLRFEFPAESKLKLRAKNVNTTGETYHHNVAINVDRETGTFERLAGALRRAL
jgi:hypothetical protein